MCQSFTFFDVLDGLKPRSKVMLNTCAENSPVAKRGLMYSIMWWVSLRTLVHAVRKVACPHVSHAREQIRKVSELRAAIKEHGACELVQDDGI